MQPNGVLVPDTVGREPKHRHGLTLATNNNQNNITLYIYLMTQN